MKDRLNQIEKLAQEFAKIAQAHGLNQYLKAIGVTYEETLPSIYYLTIGGLSVNFAFGVGFSFKDRNAAIDWLEGTALEQYSEALEVFKNNLPDIIEDERQVKIKQLMSQLNELEVLNGVAA